MPLPPQRRDGPPRHQDLTTNNTTTEKTMTTHELAFKQDCDEVGYDYDVDTTFHVLLDALPADGKWAHRTHISFQANPQDPGYITVCTLAGMNGSRRWLSDHRKVMPVAKARLVYRACLDRGWFTEDVAYAAMAS